MNYLLKPLTLESLREIVHILAHHDGDLAAIIARFGPPPLWERPTGFPTLVYIILEQQVSITSARAAFNRLLAATDPLTPQRFLELSDEALKTIGFSRQKTRYCRLLAQAVLTGQIDFAALDQLSDSEVYASLTALTGIGAWTANIYLLMALLRPDIWPASDLALIVAMQRVKGLAARPTFEEMEQLAEPWRPYRSVAARILWYHYLGGKN